MKREFDTAKGLTWVDPRTTHADVAKATQKQFAPLRDEQLKTLVLQVKDLCESLGHPMLPAFEAMLATREGIMADHAARKALSVPD